MSPRKKRLLESAAIPRAAVDKRPAAAAMPRAAVEDEPIKRPAFQKRSKHRKPGDVHTIASFCESNRISPSHYFMLKRQGRGPREIELNKRIIITPEAERDWRIEREAETQAKRQAAASSRSAVEASV
jgi:hypothetical protein